MTQLRILVICQLLLGFLMLSLTSCQVEKAAFRFQLSATTVAEYTPTDFQQVHPKVTTDNCCDTVAPIGASKRSTARADLLMPKGKTVYKPSRIAYNKAHKEIQQLHRSDSHMRGTAKGIKAITSAPKDGSMTLFGLLWLIFRFPILFFALCLAIGLAPGASGAIVFGAIGLGIIALLIAVAVIIDKVG
jgi:hypothetical protein